jgi:hypothetical protein
MDAVFWDIFTEVTMNSAAFWDMTPYNTCRVLRAVTRRTDSLDHDKKSLCQDCSANQSTPPKQSPS